MGVIFWTSYLHDSRYIPIPPSFLTITHIEEKRPDNLEISTDCPFSKIPSFYQKPGFSEHRLFIKNPGFQNPVLFFRNPGFLETPSFFQKTQLFQKPRPFKNPVLLSKNTTHFQKNPSIFKKPRPFSKTPSIFKNLAFLKIPCFFQNFRVFKKFPAQSPFWNSPFDNV